MAFTSFYSRKNYISYQKNSLNRLIIKLLLMNMVYYMNLSIIIATLDRPDNLDATLKSLLPEAELLKEIIIIDQSENRKSKQICDEYKHK